MSGSMLDGNKLGLVRQTLQHVLELLGDTDRVSLVTFNDVARREVPLFRVTPENRATVMRRFNNSQARGGTNIGGALARALSIFEQRRVVNPVSTCLLFTDGCDSTGTADMWHSLYEPLRRAGATVHTFGLGADHDARCCSHISSATSGAWKRRIGGGEEEKRSQKE